MHSKHSSLKVRKAVGSIFPTTSCRPVHVESLHFSTVSPLMAFYYTQFVVDCFRCECAQPVFRWLTLQPYLGLRTSTGGVLSYSCVPARKEGTGAVCRLGKGKNGRGSRIGLSVLKRAS